MGASDPARDRGFTGAPVAPGLPGIWTTALATAVVLGLLVVLLWIVAVNAFGWFWPSDLWRVELADGRVLVGEEAGREAARDASGTTREQIQLKVGNRDVLASDFVWLDVGEVVSRTRPGDLVRVVRTEYGDAFGRIVAATGVDGTPLARVSREALAPLLRQGRQLRREREEILDELERVRRPLTRVEEELDLIERSARSGSPEAREQAATLAARIAELGDRLAPRLRELEERLVEVDRRLRTGELELLAGETTVRVPLEKVLEVTWPNRMGTGSRLAHAAAAGWSFLFSEPREANTEGGVFPALFGTVLLVLLMSVAVVPLGVVTAVYMTEYARDGIPLRLANQAVNNLAGVPSIVFGMFGLAFFIYGVGGAVDRLFFAERLPTPTFGTGGILWASLTLALLTVPVVVVATREGLLAVPRSWREGSLALGATQWQTLRRIVLPAAMPGILTGLILAVSRAAGEVAPLMLTGAVKLAPSLPLDGVPPFLHLQRKFMHLGFHIYDVSMQSPNVEAAKPMAFATTLVLLALVVLMNLTAIVIRRRLRAAYRGQAV